MKGEERTMKKYIYFLFAGLCLVSLISCSLLFPDDEQEVFSLDEVGPAEDLNAADSLAYGQFFVTPCDAAMQYHIQIAADDDAGFSRVVYEKSDNRNPEILLEDLELEAGDYYWRVRARDAERWGAWSTPAVVTATSGLDTVNFSEQDDTTDTTPEIDWNDVAGAGSYEIRIVIDGTATLYASTTSSFEVAAGRSLSYGDDITYQIRPTFTINDATVKGFWCCERELNIYSEIIIEDSSEGAVDWQDVPEAVTYDVQIASDAGMGDIILNAADLADSSFDISSLTAGGYYLQIRYTDGDGETSEWSEVFPFTKQVGVSLVHEEEPANIVIRFTSSTMNSAVLYAEFNTEIPSFQWWLDSERLARDVETLPLTGLDGDLYTVSVIGEKSGYVYSSEFTLERTADVCTIPAGGRFYEPQRVELTCDGADTIYYAFEPILSDLSNAEVYSGPFTIRETRTIYATAQEEGKLCSQESSQQIEILDPDAWIELRTATGITAGIYAGANFPVSHFLWHVNGVEAHTHQHKLIFSNLGWERDDIHITLDASTLDYSITEAAEFVITRADQVSISPEGGLYTESQRVVLTSPSAEAIYYAYEPIMDDLSNAILYAGPFYISETRTIYATAVEAGKLYASQSSEEIVIGDLGVYLEVESTGRDTATLRAVTNMPVDSYTWANNGSAIVNPTSTLALTGLTNDSYQLTVSVSKDSHIDSDSCSLTRLPDVTVTIDGDSTQAVRYASLECDGAETVYYAFEPIAADLNNAHTYAGTLAISEGCTLYTTAACPGKLHADVTSMRIDVYDWTALRDQISGLADDGDSFSGTASPLEKAVEEEDSAVSEEMRVSTEGQPATFTTREYSCTAQANFSKQQLLSDYAPEIYPGSVLVGNGIADGNYHEVTGGRKRAISLVYNIANVTAADGGPGIVSETIIPSRSAYQNLHNRITSQDWGTQSTSYSYSVDEYYNETDMCVSLGASVSYDFGLVETTIGTSFETGENHASHVYVSDFIENFYTVTVDLGDIPFIYRDISDADFQGYRPVYVSSVTYGRIAYLSMKTQRDEESLSTSLTTALDWCIGVGQEQEYEVSNSYIIENSELSINVLGATEPVTTLDGFKAMIEDQGVNDGNRGVIVAYELRYVDTNEVANVVFMDEYSYNKVDATYGHFDVSCRLSRLYCGSYTDGAGSSCEFYGDIRLEAGDDSQSLFSYSSAHPLENVPEGGSLVLSDDAYAPALSYVCNNMNNGFEITVADFYEDDSGDNDDELELPYTVDLSFTVGDIYNTGSRLTFNGTAVNRFKLFDPLDHRKYIEFELETSAVPMYQ